MSSGIVIYYSKSGNTKQMAETIGAAMNESGLPTVIKDVVQTSVADLMAADAIVIGSPTYYGHMAASVMTLLDESVSKHGKLDGKVGAAFASSANVGGGNETTILSILEAMIVHGMVVQGDPQGDHYGPVSIGKPDSRSLAQCKNKGKRIADLAKKLFP
jgi:NAD(P)H dehydrogenase (quinone)